MEEAPETKAKTDVTSEVFEEFLKLLSEKGTPEDVVARLRRTLIEKKQFSERALREAIFPPSTRL